MPSQAYLSAVNARNNPEILVTLVHISHPGISLSDFPNGIRVHDSGSDIDDTIISNGITYVPWAFKIPRPDSRTQAVPVVPIEIDSVSPEIMRAIIHLQTPPEMEMTMWTVLRSAPDTIEYGPIKYVLRTATDNSKTIRGEVAMSTSLVMAWPRHSFTPMTSAFT